MKHESLFHTPAELTVIMQHGARWGFAARRFLSRDFRLQMSCQFFELLSLIDKALQKLTIAHEVDGRGDGSGK